MAASGGYYISAQADKIFATEETVTGSIGCDHVRIELFRTSRKTGCGRYNS